jgi:orotidine-5'-phosphate decarboxylase
MVKRLNFRDRIRLSSMQKHSRIVLALDPQDLETSLLFKKAFEILEQVYVSIAAVKFNYHILLPLDLHNGVAKIVDRAHDYGLQAIADLKLNDIASTNLVAANHLWKAGFDALIANPFVGYEGGLGPVLSQAHDQGKGVILLVYMSHPGSKEGYELTLSYDSGSMKVYELFLRRALKWKADGIVVGATVPKLIKSISRKVAGRLLIFSPGIVTQGGVADQAVKAGADFLIVGRTIIESLQPQSSAEDIRQATWRPY